MGHTTAMRQVARSPSILSAALLSVAVLACDSQPSDVGGPGTLFGVLVSPDGSEGAVLMDLTGPGLGTVRTSGGVVFTEISGDRLRLLVVRDRAGTIEFSIDVADVRTPPDVAVQEVADGSDQLRTSLEGYRVRFRRVRVPFLSREGPP
jgi:hypothetical protein